MFGAVNPDQIAFTPDELPKRWYNIAGESAHAVRAAIDEEKKAESAGEEKCILANINGHSFLDLDAYRSKVRLD